MCIFTSRISSQGRLLREICRGSGLNSEVGIFDKTRKPRYIDWRDRQNKTNSDFTIKIEGLDKEFCLHKNVLSRSSGFFFNIAIGNVQQSKWQFQDCSAQGEIYVRNQDSQTIAIGRACDTLISFKKQVQESQKIPVSKQKYYILRNSKKVELSESWKKLSDYGVQPGDDLLLVTPGPWYSVEVKKTGVQLSLPKPCLEVFERVLDFMYSYRCDKSCFRVLGELSPSSALGMLWLADSLDIPDLGDHIVRYLESVVTPQTAHSFLASAVELDQVEVLGELCQLASQGLDSMPAEVCVGLPLEVVEAVLESACVSKAKNRLLISYMQAREVEGKLDDQLYRRLMRVMDADLDFRGCRENAAVNNLGRDSADPPAEREGEQCSSLISVEDAAALLGLARRFGDAEVEQRCLRCVTRMFSGLGAEDLARLPVQVVQDVLGNNELEVIKKCHLLVWSPTNINEFAFDIVSYSP